jgi:glucose/arabinose dehydrogenase
MRRTDTARATARRPLPAALVLVALLLVAPGTTGRAGAQPATGIGPLDLQIEVVTTSVSDPTSLEIADDGTFVIGERQGAIKLVTTDGSVATAGTLAVSANACPGCPAEEYPLEEGGLHGLLLHPGFTADGGRLLAYYSVPHSLGVPPVTPVHPDAGGVAADEGLFRLSRFTVEGGVLQPDSEEVLLENPAEWYECCHYGGDLEWLADGTVVLSTGDDTSSRESNGFSPHDANPGRDAFNAMRTSQNPADRRGKILRVDVDDVDGDGSLVPADNPWVDDPAFDPFVYAMGFRSNYRFDVDPTSQALIVGNVGPDGVYPDPAFGPASKDEVEVVPPGGGTNHGWPMCVGANEPYIQRADFAAEAPGEPFDCTGMTPAQVHYAYLPDPQFPTLLTGGRTALAGPVYRTDGGPGTLGEAYDGSFILLEWSRQMLYGIPFDPESATLDTTLINPVVVQGMAGPIDAEVGPDDALYVLNYGAGYYQAAGGSLVRVTCARCGDGVTSPVGVVREDPSSRAAAGPLVIGMVLAAAAWATRRRQMS